MIIPEGKKILITGGAGYIGSHIAVELMNLGIPVVIFDHMLSAASRDRAKVLSDEYPELCTIVQDDLRIASDTERMFQSHVFHGVIHCAAFKSPIESMTSPEKYYENNVESTDCLLAMMQKYQVHDLVFSSSCSVHGEFSGENITEDAPTKPLSPYAETKLICEEHIMKATKTDPNLRAINLRYFNPVGSHEDLALGDLEEGANPHLVTALILGNRDHTPLKVFGNDYPTRDGTCLRDYIHIKDIAEAHVHALAHLAQQAPGVEIFNIGRGEGVSVLEMVNLFEKSSGKKVDISYESRRSGDIVAIYANTQKAEKGLGWKAKRSLEDAIKSTWDLYQKTLAKAGNAE